MNNRWSFGKWDIDLQLGFMIGLGIGLSIERTFYQLAVWVPGGFLLVHRERTSVTVRQILYRLWNVVRNYWQDVRSYK